MSKNRRQAFRLRFLRSMLCLAALALLAHPAAAQPKKAKQTPQIIEVVIGAKGATVKDVDLRPNSPTEFQIELKNNAGEILGDVKVKVVQVVDDQVRVIAETQVTKLEQTPEKAKGLIVDTFDKIKGAPEKVELVGSPPYLLQVHIQAKNLAPMKRELKLIVREPRDYLEPTVKFDSVENVLQVGIETKGDKALVGQHSLPVQLVLGPDIKATKKGMFSRTLTASNQKLSLVADEIAFERKLSEGDVYLKVDGYDRAFTYPIKDNTGGAINPRAAGEIRVRIGVPRYARPDVKFEVPLEIDGPLSADYKVQVGLDRTGDIENFSDIPANDLRELDGLRQQTIVTNISPEGKLICQAAVRDWRPVFDASEIYGRNVKFRVRVLNKDETVKLAAVSESRPLVAKTEIDVALKGGPSVFALITLDESPAEGIKFELPKDNEAAIGSSFEVRASIKERKATQAPIARVIVFRGKPKDDKEEIKADDILAEDVAPDPKQTEWKFTLPAPSKAETLPLSVRFITVTGAKSGTTEMISIKPGVVAKKLYTIKGQVLVGSLPQQDLEVLLKDAKGNVKDKAKSGPKGVFVFENVEAGVYLVSSSEIFRNRIGEVKVDVPSADKKDVSVSLFAK